MQKTLTLNPNQQERKELYDFLSRYGEIRTNSNKYVDWHIKGAHFSCVMYGSGKLVLQVSDKDLENKVLKLVSKEEESDSFKPHVGSDEVGKGDFFGPLVVCACYVDFDTIKTIDNLGIMDSKKLDDAKISRIGDSLVETLIYEVRIVMPEEYNKLIKKLNNASILLAKCHVEVIEKLVGRLDDKEVDSVVVDQFSKSKARLSNEFNLKLPLRQFHKGESDVAVACASIIARRFFLLEWEKMNKSYNFSFPLGATHVIRAGKEFVQKFGTDELGKVAKTSFRTMDSIIENT